MNKVIDLEKEISALPPAERERLATVAWESLVGDPSAAGDHNIDPEGIEIAAQGDAEIESVQVQPIAHAEFLTPYAEAYHHQSATRGYEDTPEKQARFAGEVRYMQNRWGRLPQNDPAYSPNLTLEREEFSYAWPPLRVSAGVAPVDQEVWTPKAEPVRK